MLHLFIFLSASLPLPPLLPLFLPLPFFSFPPPPPPTPPSPSFLPHLLPTTFSPLHLSILRLLPPFLFPFLSSHYPLATLKGSSLLLYQCDDITNLSEDAHVDLRLGKQTTPLNCTIASCTKFNQSYEDILLLYTVQLSCVSLVFACL